ncbi:GNAT family N-acetyltransferase [Methylosinus sporium]|uniref:GNAT family N-acetyltransferase n=1 Tax=Methylosinus sporium TaxID=428 RepID=A0A549T096_METSR|nr:MULTISPECIES: GNAT family N-acetyltransferase [Methylosinus]MBU3886946.1 GNAT family N-acetyltransferase [Methylosinus sp. KRF6]TRL35301.1 GNAT family N-acetyltransferase [Methylosinus sporium]
MDESDPTAEMRLGRRNETPADAAFRFELFCRSRPPGEEFGALDPSLRDMLLRQQFLAQIAGYHAQFPQARHEILEIGEEPVGRLVVERGVEALHIVDLAIMPQWRSRGIGARLLRELADEARIAHMPARFRSFLLNEDGNRLFQRLGFIPVARTELQIVWESRSGDEPLSPPEGRAPARP